MIWAIVAIAFLVRFIYILQLKATIFYSHLMLDEAFYSNWAGQIAGGDWLGHKVFNALPLYPYILGIFYRLFSPSLIVPRLAGVILSSISCYLIYLISARFFDRRSGLIAAFICAIYGPFIFYSGLIAPTAFVIFFYLLALFLLSKALDSPGCFRFFAAGCAIGLAAMTKAGMLLFAPVFFLWFIITSEKKASAVRWAVFAFLGITAALTPVALRNSIVSGDGLSVTSHAGLNFYIGNNKDADGAFKPPGWARSNIKGLTADSKTIAEDALSRPLKDSEVSRFYFKKAFEFIKDEPFTFLRLITRKLFLLLNRQELYDVAYYNVYEEQVPILKAPFLTFLLVCPLGLLGIFIAYRDRKRLAPLHIFVITYAVSVLLYFINSRYRIPFALAMIMFAGFFISWFWGLLKEKSYGRAFAVWPLLIAVSIPVAVSSGIDRRADGYTNLGSLYMDAGEYDKAIDALKRAIEFKNPGPKPYNDIGYIYIMQNKPRKAREYLETALSKDPEYPFARINLGLFYEKSGDLGAAEREYKKALDENPNIPQAHNNLAGVYEKTGRREMAMEGFRRSIELDPDRASTHYNLGVIYGRAKRLREAKAEFEKAVELDPNFAPARKALTYFRKRGQRPF